MKYGFMPIVQFHANSHTRDQALTPPPQLNSPFLLVLLKFWNMPAKEIDQCPLAL